MMNLNFYNPQNQSLDDMQRNLQEQMRKLEQLRSLSVPNNLPSQNSINIPVPNNPVPEQKPANTAPEAFYDNIKNLKNWNLFLETVYGITDDEMFQDYKLFMTALDEVEKDESREKLESMKAKLTKNKNKEQKIKKFKREVNVESDTIATSTPVNTNESENNTKGGSKNVK